MRKRSNAGAQGFLAAMATGALTLAADLANPQVLKDLVVTLPDGRCGVVASIDVGSGSLACMLLMGTVVKDKDKGKDVKFVHDKSSNGGFVQEMRQRAADARAGHTRGRAGGQRQLFLPH